MNQVIVTINDDYDQYNIKGCLGVVLAYDRDKRFLVKVIEGKETGLYVWLKPHWLDGIDEVVGSYQHMALYKFPSNIDTPESKKERFKYYKNQVRKPYNCFSKSHLEYQIKVGEVNYKLSTRKALISKVRYALQTDQDFSIWCNLKSKWSSASGGVVDSSFYENSYDIYDNNFTEVDKKVRNLQRKIEKIIKEY